MDYPFVSLGPGLNVLALILLFFFAALAAAALLAVAALPGMIARRRRHPQAAAVNLCGWLGLPTGFGWIIAMIWAYWTYPGMTGTAGSPATAHIRTISAQLERMEVAVAQLEHSTGSRTP